MPGAPKPARRDDILNDRALMPVQSIGGDIRDVRVTDGLGNDRRYQQSSQHLVFRHWSGRPLVETG